MSTAKRRKVSATTARNPTSSARSITAFTKVSKAQVVSKSIYDKTDRLDIIAVAQSTEPNRKRKLQIVEEVDTDTDTVAADQASIILSAVLNLPERDTKSFSQQSLASSQKLPRTAPKPRPSTSTPHPKETSSTDARDLLDDFALTSSSPTNDKHPLKHLDQLPTELQDLINLHASFLTALTLHHAHNGTYSPADLRLLCPDVARAWGKRKVLLEDIQRTLGVVNGCSIESGLTLSDYGHGKICVETNTGSWKSGMEARPLDENRLNEAYALELRRLWAARDSTADLVSAFIQTLPLESITMCSSLDKMSPLLFKGQQRLENLRAGITLKKEADKEKLVVVTSIDDGQRKPTLLERLKAKQLLKSNLPPLPSKAELGRKAALHRLEEVVSVLTLLTTSTSIGQARVSFTMPTVLGKLRDSFKTPMSKEEADTCVRLLALEVAPEWLKVVRMGKLDAIVVSRDNRPTDLDIKGRVMKAVLV